MDMASCKLVNCQVKDRDCLEDEKGLDFRPPLEDFAIVDHSNNHVNGHHSNLEHDPGLLGTIGK